jgi:hypothetical protein
MKAIEARLNPLSCRIRTISRFGDDLMRACELARTLSRDGPQAHPVRSVTRPRLDNSNLAAAWERPETKPEDDVVPFFRRGRLDKSLRKLRHL